MQPDVLLFAVVPVVSTTVCSTAYNNVGGRVSITITVIKAPFVKQGLFYLNRKKGRKVRSKINVNN
jgi:hypothetical protein